MALAMTVHCVTRGETELFIETLRSADNFVTAYREKDNEQHHHDDR